MPLVSQVTEILISDDVGCVAVSVVSHVDSTGGCSSVGDLALRADTTSSTTAVGFLLVILVSASSIR